ncbi:glycosyltransferase family 2 protein [Aquabacterium sp.]|uniref:glycosyltransferase family 2 protein n=1 Tax=Aquabacterium sp. TaxID=1872578 RepID=UPI0019B07FCA|nr:glycosyltransferase family 2 protein [Aquabacterium sp.]MBC7700157.1 glycosyltransferase family 2 protein [Aquabacterium sp.]
MVKGSRVTITKNHAVATGHHLRWSNANGNYAYKKNRVAMHTLAVERIERQNSEQKMVSVVVTNYNYGHFLADAIDSVLHQDHASIEIIVVDDASTDDSRHVLSAYLDRVQVAWQTQNLGQISAYNRGFGMASGDIVIFLDADDRLKSGAIAEIVQAFAGERVVKVHWRADLVDVAGQATGAHVPAKLVAGDMSKLIVDKGILYPSSPGSANAYLASALKQIMPLPTDSAEKHGADFYTIYGIALLGKVAIAGDGRALSDYRLHSRTDRAVLSFGNAAQGYRETERMGLRSQTFQRWVAGWSEQRISVTLALTEFSIEKNSFANSIFAQAGYWSGLKVGMGGLKTLVRSIRHRPGCALEKLALTTIILAILVLPRPAGLPIAKYLCDPSSR